MYRLFLLFLAIAGNGFYVQSQSLYMPRNIRQAFEKGTRSPDGMPGKNYWQNTGRYAITITAMPPDRTVRGTEQISYVNHSPDTLRSLVIKLILNIHKPGAARYGDADSAYLTSGTHIDAFAVNGKQQPWPENTDHFTWQEVELPQPLLPQDSVQLSFDWHYQISLKSGREGMIDSTTYFLAYFYPRVAVYDDYYGWDKLDFTDGQEFYNDFNDYTLTVRVPENYLVWATGTLQNADQVLEPLYVQRLAQSMKSDTVIRVAGPKDLEGKFVTRQNLVNTWKWKADNVTDVTLALSDHYVWDASSVVVDDATGRRAGVQSAYNDTAADFHQMVAFGRHALDWLSHNWPGIPYPYPKTTVVQGYADMEYPMMVNDGTEENPDFSRFVAEHEIAHTWFPFYMGINESRYGFMDEGWATTFELLIGRVDLGVKSADNFYKTFRVTRWIHDPSAEEDLPIITPANVLRGVAYGNNAYGKPSLGYLAVKDLLGDDLFRKCLHEYMARWHGKHPIPWDFFNSFNSAAGKNLDWFWNNWFFSNYYIDLAIQKVTPVKGGYAVTIQNTGGMAAPVDVEVRYSDGSTGTFHQTPAIWEKDQRLATVKIGTQKKIQTVTLQGGIFMDANEADNSWTADK